MELDKNTTALLVIDAIEAVGDDSLYDPDAATAAYRDAVAHAVAACHAAGVPQGLHPSVGKHIKVPLSVYGIDENLRHPAGGDVP